MVVVKPRPAMLVLFFVLLELCSVGVQGFQKSSARGRRPPSFHDQTQTHATISLCAADSTGSEEPPSSSFRPLYDGTNYTFPDTTSPSGIAELLEVSFVKACMQLASGYVDILKLFIAASVAAYESGFSLPTIQKELEQCPNQTANRQLMPEEETLRFQWLCVIYLTLSLIQHTTRGDARSLMGDIPDSLRDKYESLIGQVAEAYVTSDQSVIPSVEGPLSASKSQEQSPPLTEMDQAILAQSLRVATLTPVVLHESEAARANSAERTPIDPPRPPIKGAFE